MKTWLTQCDFYEAFRFIFFKFLKFPKINSFKISRCTIEKFLSTKTFIYFVELEYMPMKFQCLDYNCTNSGINFVSVLGPIPAIFDGIGIMLYKYQFCYLYIISHEIFKVSS